MLQNGEPKKWKIKALDCKSGRMIGSYLTWFLWSGQTGNVVITDMTLLDPPKSILGKDNCRTKKLKRGKQQYYSRFKVQKACLDWFKLYVFSAVQQHYGSWKRWASGWAPWEPVVWVWLEWRSRILYAVWKLSVWVVESSSFLFCTSHFIPVSYSFLLVWLYDLSVIVHGSLGLMPVNYQSLNYYLCVTNMWKILMKN